jgi:polyribonucleotide nucleotidyltransferase
MINTIQAETGAEITVDDDGMSGIVSIASPDREKVAEAERQVMLIVDPPSAHVGEVYEGRVVNITKFGAFVNILPGRDGLVHISKLGGGKRIDKVEDVLALGDAIEVEVEDIDPNGKISLRPLSDSDNDQSHEDKSSETIEEDESSDRDDDSSDADDFNQKDDDSDNRDSGSKAKTAASFEDAFQAELEAVHGDLGKSSSRRSGERKRR